MTHDGIYYRSIEGTVRDATRASGYGDTYEDILARALVHVYAVDLGVDDARGRDLLDGIIADFERVRDEGCLR